IYGYPGKKSGLEIPDLRRVKFQDAPGLFKIFMLHTTIDKAKGSLPIDSIEVDLLPKADYYALGHLHIDFEYENFVYAGPTFPNNFQELEELKGGCFYIVDTELKNPFKRINLKTKEIESFDLSINDATIATEKIINEVSKRDLYNKLVLLRIHGILEKGKHSDIKFTQIEEFIKEKGAYFVLRNTHDLSVKGSELEFETKDSNNIEDEAISAYSGENPSQFNNLIPYLLEIFSMEKQEDERSAVFESRLFEEAKKVFNFDAF
ncbi:MAG: hypothetical protein AABY22_19225, partial [Nanoarchaeota archaeon]